MTDKLKELISKAKETGDFSQHHSLIQFNEGLTLENILYQWWDDMESEDVAATKMNAIQELLRRIDKWMPENPSIFEDEEECDMIVGINTAIRMFHRKIKMTNRNISKEICHSYYIDMENGNDTETIDYGSLICILTELVDRIEKLEQRLDKQEEYEQEQNV